MSNYPNFETKTFSDIYQSSKGQEIWDFLNEAISINRMAAVSDVGKPALLAIESLLIKKGFISERDSVSGEHKAQFDRLKQMLGAMVRQVMENNGYQLHSNNVKVPNSKVFYSASSYKSKE
ncbi:MAG: hypothetical protein KDI39_06970 [Pseudomonadales bacterium]|nr:hypothetical protein [Pseudomonadales bacterium]